MKHKAKARLKEIRNQNNIGELLEEIIEKALNDIQDKKYRGQQEAQAGYKFDFGEWKQIRINQLENDLKSTIVQHTVRLIDDTKVNAPAKDWGKISQIFSMFNVMIPNMEDEQALNFIKQTLKEEQDPEVRSAIKAVAGIKFKDNFVKLAEYEEIEKKYSTDDEALNAINKEFNSVVMQSKDILLAQIPLVLERSAKNELFVGLNGMVEGNIENKLAGFEASYGIE